MTAEVVEVLTSTAHTDRLFWMCHSVPPRNLPSAYYFSIDSVLFTQELVYEPFCNDFGPLNLGMVFHYCKELEKLLKNSVYSNYRIYHYTAVDPVKRVNSAFLISAFQVLVLGKTGVEAWALFRDQPSFPDYRDASFGTCAYKCTVLHCLRGLEIAIKLGWLNYSTFDLDAYEKYEKLENGDMNWIIPGKMLAFSCPSPSANDESGWRCFTPEDYAPEFRKMNITAVVRLNNKTYDSSVLPTQRFTRLGFRHYDLYFLDGSVPSEEIVQRFLSVAENEPGALAVHCKAGLGRTGTLIGIYAMKHFSFPPAEFIGWIRVCRPGSVLGPQQQFLVSIEGTVRKWANEHALAKAVKTPSKSQMKTPMKNSEKRDRLSASLNESMELSPEDVSKATFGDSGQAERLISAKKASSYKSSPARSPEKPSPRGQSLGPVSPPIKRSSQSKPTPPSSKPTSIFNARPSPVARRATRRSIF